MAVDFGITTAGGGNGRRRYVSPALVPVYVAAGRWGPRRLRVSECDAVIKAEDLYDLSILAGVALTPGFAASVSVSPAASLSDPWRLSIELRPNLIWRFGRLFLRCRRCDGRVTRLYFAVPGAAPRCRRCWGLSYSSRAWSYHGQGKQVCELTTRTSRTWRRRSSRLRCARRSSMPSVPPLIGP